MGNEDDREDNGGEKQQQQQQASGGLLRAVWFRQMLHRWQQSSTTTAAGGSSGASTESTDEQSNINNDNAAAGDDDDDSVTNPRKTNNPPVLQRVVEAAGGADDPGPSPLSPMTPDRPAPADVPRGCCAVYVGAERRRFVVPTAYLDMPVFARLLEKAEDEFGFDYHGAGITIPCDTEAFKYILVVMDAHRRGLVDDEGNPKDRVQQPAKSSGETR